jgi:hypothetical protein
MWSTDTTQLDARTRKSIVYWNGAPLSARKAYELCESSSAFRQAFINDLCVAPFSAFFWETPALTTDTAERVFEYVITDAPKLANVLPEVQAFSEHFVEDTMGHGIVVFENLSRDAMLVVPCPIAEHVRYTHLGAFVRGAPQLQVHALLRTVGQAVLARMSNQPTWVSTAGMGVYWLHIRLDSRPKYYRHTPYTRT